LETCHHFLLFKASCYLSNTSPTSKLDFSALKLFSIQFLDLQFKISPSPNASHDRQCITNLAKLRFDFPQRTRTRLNSATFYFVVLSHSCLNISLLVFIQLTKLRLFLSTFQALTLSLLLPPQKPQRKHVQVARTRWHRHRCFFSCWHGDLQGARGAWHDSLRLGEDFGNAKAGSELIEAKNR
jgi:hypothetical protein